LGRINDYMFFDCCAACFRFGNVDDGGIVINLVSSLGFGIFRRADLVCPHGCKEATEFKELSM
jgi:hypothetical protein